MKIGKSNILKVIKLAPPGAYLDGGIDQDGEPIEILLPSGEVPAETKEGDDLTTFIYFDSSDRLIASTKNGLSSVGSFTVLKVKSIERVGAFLDWGLSKDLFLPFAEQTRDLSVGMELVVYTYLDNTSRIAASMRIERNAVKEEIPYPIGQSVDLLIFGKTDLGYKAIIDDKYIGMIFNNEVFQEIKYGQKIEGFLKNVREDGKVDLSLHKTGHQGAEGIDAKILDLLNSNQGFLAITDKTNPDEIYRLFAVSKKKFKIALGGLYKKRQIQIKDDGIYLLKNRPTDL